MNNVMTAEQAFNYAMNKHPSLYASDNLEQAQYKFYDHIFNVNGNGYRDLEEFTNAFKVTKENESLLHEFPSKYIEPGDIYYGYTKTRTLGSGEHTFEMAESDSIVNGLFTKEEQGTHPEIKKFISINKDERVPYPNFEKNYSMVWNMDMSQLDISWTKAAIWYYEKSKEFFNSDKIHLYHYAYPQDEKKQEKLIQDYEKNFERYKKDGQTQEELNAVITKEYGFEYKGNTSQFIKGRWNKELNRIFSFIDETLEKLHNELSFHPEATSTKRIKP